MSHEQNSKSFYQKILDNLLEGCQILGFDWRYIYLNHAAEAQNRRSNEELIGQRYSDMWPGIEKTEIYRLISECMEFRHPQWMQNEFTFPDGAKGWYELRISPVPEGVLIMSLDISERVKAEEMRRKAERFQSIESGRAQLSAMLLHNIGNVVTPVVVHLNHLKNDELRQLAAYFEKSWIELKKHEKMLTEYVNADAKGKQIFAFLGQLVEALKGYDQETKDIILKMDSAMAYISESISLQQQYAAQNNEARQMTNINTLITDALRMQNVSLEKRGITVHKQFTENLPELIIERNKLMQVVVNFIKNSLEAIDENKDNTNRKSITVRTFLTHERIGFEIIDTGIGVEPSEIDNLFEFGKSGKGSTGLGLYYCKSFIEGTGGTLKMMSDGIGKGATTRVIF